MNDSSTIKHEKTQTAEKTLDALKRQKKILDTLNETAIAFLSQSNETFNDLMTKKVAIIADVVNVDRLSVWRSFKKPDGLHASQIYRWERKSGGSTRTLDKFADIAYADYVPNWEKFFVENKAVNSPVRLMSTHEAAVLQAFGMASVFAAPVYINDSFWGVVLFEDHHSERFFSEDYAKLMRSAALLFANAVVRDEMERATIDALFEAQEANRAKSDFLSHMSHEMLTPMNAIIGMTQILKMSGESQKTIDNLDEIERAARHLLKLINNLLDISDKTKSSFTLANSVFNFNKMFHEILRKMSRDVMEKRQTFSSNIDPSIPISLYGDKEHLSQVITSLLINASKFSPEHGKIHISAYVLDEDNEDETITMQIEITDTGIGIPKEMQNKIFSIFEVVDGGMTRKHNGVGLGLPISKRIVEMMGGKIWVDSELDKGSKFTFTCKLRRAALEDER